MKKLRIFNLLLANVLAFIVVGCSGPLAPHIGEWADPNPSPESYNSLVLNRDNSAIFSVDDMIMGGNNFFLVEDGIEIRMKVTYEIDYEKDPAWIDFELYPEEIKFSEGSEKYSTEHKLMIEEMFHADKKQQTSYLKGIIRFVSDNQMELQTSEISRPTVFDPENEDYLLLKRIK